MFLPEIQAEILTVWGCGRPGNLHYVIKYLGNSDANSSLDLTLKDTNFPKLSFYK